MKNTEIEKLISDDAAAMFVANGLKFILISELVNAMERVQLKMNIDFDGDGERTLYIY